MPGQLRIIPSGTHTHTRANGAWAKAYISARRRVQPTNGNHLHGIAVIMIGTIAIVVIMIVNVSILIDLIVISATIS